MHSYVTARAASLTNSIEHPEDAHSLVENVGAFVEVLECLPDYPADAFAPPAIHRVRAEAEEVIVTIERWVEAHPDGRVNLRLVGAIYGIRRALEEINRWQKHYASSLHH
jgi:hypothetical protein